MAVLDQGQRTDDDLQHRPERRHNGLQRGRHWLRQEEPRTLYQEHRRHRPAVPRGFQSSLLRGCLPVRLDRPYAAGHGCPAPERKRGYNRKIPEEQAGSHACVMGTGWLLLKATCRPSGRAGPIFYVVCRERESPIGTNAKYRLYSATSAFNGNPEDIYPSRVLLNLTSRPEGFRLRALPEPYVNFSIHTAPEGRPQPAPMQSSTQAQFVCWRTALSKGVRIKHRLQDRLASRVWERGIRDLIVEVFPPVVADEMRADVFVTGVFRRLGLVSESVKEGLRDFRFEIGSRKLAKHLVANVFRKCFVPDAKGIQRDAIV